MPVRVDHSAGIFISGDFDVVLKLFVVQVSAGITVCPRSSDPFYIVSYYNKTGHYFLDIQQLYFHLEFR